MPTLLEVKSSTNVELSPLNLTTASEQFFYDDFERFVKHVAMNDAILASVDYLESGEYGSVEKLIKDAVSIGLTKNLGIEYFNETKERLQRLRDKSNLVPTGWRDIDHHLFGGVGRGELSVFCGSSGVGKSVVLMNQAVNFMKQGLNGIYFTLELSADLCAKRIDSLITGISTKEVLKRINDVDLTLKMIEKTSGKLRIIELPAQITIAQLKVCIKELEILTNRALDFIIVDYLDLMLPAGVKISVSDQFMKDKYVSEELRNLAKEHNSVLVTASQLNRQAHESNDLGHEHISGGISKINTSDNVFAISASASEKARGELKIKFLKTRNSNGVGNYVTLDFDDQTLKVNDKLQTSSATFGQANASKILGLEQKLVTKARAVDANELMELSKFIKKGV